jgi:predicted nucleotidyltransferase
VRCGLLRDCLPGDQQRRDADEDDMQDDGTRSGLEIVAGRLRSIYGSRLLELILFGSVARGEGDPESDLDVLAVLRGPLDRAVERRRLDEPLWELMLAVGRVVSVIPVEQHDLDDESPLMLNVRREGVRVR